MRSIDHNAYGIGLRNEHLTTLANAPVHKLINFLELAPENWINMGGAYRYLLEKIASKYPLIAHGLSLSIGSSVALNTSFLKEIKLFLDEYNIAIYSEHLSFSNDSKGYLYELLPIPRYKEALSYLAHRIDQVQEIIQRPLVLENISYYHSYPDQMPEYTFIQELIKLSGCQLLLDINNVYVNSVNHNYDALEFITHMPTEAIRYYHLAGHLKKSDRFLLDTHGKEVTPEVLKLAQQTIQLHGNKPLLLERDNNTPPLSQLCNELLKIKQETHCYV
ncbi:DUF692 domain-containing protein [Cysteiniphilum halobium]|uniref:DUF692 domain-containing protein n=1 Tax=Cysteiniphilum halobium TaxID=2219059 RepID=UPI003F86909E